MTGLELLPECYPTRITKVKIATNPKAAAYARVNAASALLTHLTKYAEVADLVDRIDALEQGQGTATPEGLRESLRLILDESEAS